MRMADLTVKISAEITRINQQLQVQKNVFKRHLRTKTATETPKQEIKALNTRLGVLQSNLRKQEDAVALGSSTDRADLDADALRQRRAGDAEREDVKASN